MSIPLNINGAVFEYPENFDENWGVNATGWAQAVTNGMLQRQGGNFPLTADANFGASFGLVAAYYTSRATNPATVGTLRLASADPGVAFRNNANSGNLILTTDSSDNLLYNGHVISATSTGPVTSITGTANQIIASAPTGAITLSLPQSIATSSAVAFGSVEAPLIEAGNLSGVGFIALAGSGMALQAASGGGAVTIKGPSSSGTSYTVLFPIAQGGAGTFLQNDGSGILSWNTLSGTGTVNSGTTPNIAYYATSSNAVSDSGISRANLFLADGSVSATGAFNLNSHKITNLTNGSSAQDAVAFTQLSAYLPLTGGTMSGAIAMGANKVTGLANGTAAQDATAFGQVSGVRTLQIVQGTSSTGLSLTTSYQASSLTITITPISSLSKIVLDGFIQAWAQISATSHTESLSIAIYKNGVLLFDYGEALVIQSTSVSEFSYTTLPIRYVDSPATTSATTYTIYGKISTTANSGAGELINGLVNTPTALLTATEIG